MRWWGGIGGGGTDEEASVDDFGEVIDCELV